MSWGRFRGGDDGEVGSQDVGDGEEAETVSETPHSSQPFVDPRVDEQLERYANDAQHSHCETYTTRWHAETACKAKGQCLMRMPGRLRVFRVEAWSGQVDEPKIVEGADVHG